MRRVRIGVERLRRYAADTSFQVYGDYGSGPIDFVHAMTPRAVALWPEAARRAGHVRDGHLSLRHLDSVDPDGHLEGLHVGGEHFYPALEVSYDTPAYVFGRFTHAVRMVDGAGNESGSATAAVTINAAPTVPGCVARASYDSLSDQITFSFWPSRFEPVPGK